MSNYPMRDEIQTVLQDLRLSEYMAQRTYVDRGAEQERAAPYHFPLGSSSLPLAPAPHGRQS